MTHVRIGCHKFSSFFVQQGALSIVYCAYEWRADTSFKAAPRRPAPSVTWADVPINVPDHFPTVYAITTNTTITTITTTTNDNIILFN